MSMLALPSKLYSFSLEMIFPILLLQATVFCRVAFSSGELQVFIQKPETVKSGDDVFLNCSVVRGGPAQSITWSADYRDDYRSETKFLKNVSSSNWLGLQLADVKLSDSGKYHCSVEKDKETDRHSFDLEVKASPKITLSDHFLIVNTKKIENIVTCEATGLPRPSIVWFFNGAKLDYSGLVHGSIYTEQDKEKKYDWKTSRLRLFIASVRKETHGGNYTCQASNELGVAQRSLQVLVAVDPKMEVGEEQYACEGTHATLTCEAKSVLKQDTEVTSSWKFKKQQIQPGEDPRYEANLYRASDSASLELVVLNASLVDSGDYSCIVKNREGEATGKTRLNVISKDVQPEVAIEGKRIVETKLGLDVTLLCHVSYPRFMKNAHSSWLNVMAGKQRREVQMREGSLAIVQMSLEIVNVTLQHEGRYVCVLNSTEGMYTDQVTLKVTDPNAPRHGKAESSRPSSSLTVAVLIISGGTLLTVIGLVLRHRIRRPQTHFNGNYIANFSTHRSPV